MTAVEFTRIPARTGDFRTLMDELSASAATMANALNEGNLEVWREAIRQCLVGEGMEINESYTRSREVARQIGEVHKWLDLVARHAGHSVRALARLDQSVGALRDIRSGQTFKVDA